MSKQLTRPQLEKQKLKLDLIKNLFIIALLASALATSCDAKKNAEAVLDNVVKLQMVVDQQEQKVNALYSENENENQ